MKKRTPFLLALILIFTLAFTACGNDNTSAPSSDAGNESSTSEEAESNSTASEEESKADGEEAGMEEVASSETAENTETNTTASQNSEQNILVTYFSLSGNTEEVAQLISQHTGGDLAEIQRAEAYGDLEEEAEAEILNGEHPEITVSVDNVADYDTIFVGYPIWWDEAPAMIATFLAENDFSGKTMIPFCTSSSDDIGNSLHIFRELCPNAEIAEGLTANDLDDLEPWLQSLGLL